MTKRFVEIYGITSKVLGGMQPGTHLGPFPEGYMVNPDRRLGSDNSGYPEAECTIYRFGENELGDTETSAAYRPKGKYGIVNRLSKIGGSSGPKAGGQTAEEVLAALLTDTHSAPGEIKNKGEVGSHRLTSPGKRD